MNYKINSLFVLVCFVLCSCKAQTKINYTDCKESKDFYNIVYKLSCFKNEKIYKVFYVDSVGNTNEICSKPDEQAILFNSEEDFLGFVDQNLVWYTEEDIEGQVLIALYINENGIILEKRVLKTIDVCPKCTTSAIDLIGKIVPIKPAYKNGNPVKSMQIISIPFK